MAAGNPAASPASGGETRHRPGELLHATPGEGLQPLCSNRGGPHGLFQAPSTICCCNSPQGMHPWWYPLRVGTLGSFAPSVRRMVSSGSFRLDEMVSRRGGSTGLQILPQLLSQDQVPFSPLSTHPAWLRVGCPAMGEAGGCQQPRPHCFHLSAQSSPPHFRFYVRCHCPRLSTLRFRVRLFLLELAESC